MKQDTSASSNPSGKALSGPLFMVTLCTGKISPYKKFYVEGMGMTLDGPLDISEEQKEKQKLLWNIPEEADYDLYHLYQNVDPSLINIRLLHLKSETPSIHSSYSSRELGPLSLGFPNHDQERLDDHLQKKGITFNTRMYQGSMPSHNGTDKHYLKSIYSGPDFVQCEGIEYKGELEKMKSVDNQVNVGGPGYSSFVTDRSEDELKFYTKVLGMELKVDLHLTSSTDSNPGIEKGVPYRYCEVYADGCKHNNLVIIDFMDGVFIDTDVLPRVPNQGMGMWTFKTKDIGEILARAHGSQIKVYRTPRKVNDVIYGEAITMILLTPSGYLVEVINTV